MLAEVDVNTVKINEDYAKKYSKWRAKEEKQKFETRFGIDVEDSSSSESEEEDEDGALLTGVVDSTWLRALTAVKKNDPRIYKSDYKFFEETAAVPAAGSSSSESVEDKKRKVKKGKETKKNEEHKPLYMREYERKLITEKGGILSESEDDSEAEQRTRTQTYAEQQETLRKSIKSAVAEVSSDDEDEDLLTQRTKTRKEHEEEEEEFLQFLKGQKKAQDLKKDKHLAAELAPLKEFLNDPGLDKRERELWDYILGQKFRTKTKHNDQDWYLQQMAQLQADEEVDEAERKYNFRFEEPDTDYIKTYERNPKDTLRQKDNKRAQKRQEIKERKKTEKDKLLEEIRQMKNLKRKEIMEKLEQLKEVTGNPDIAFTSKDIEEEFDPSAHDRMMEKYFGDDFYHVEEGKKPTFPDDDDDEYEFGTLSQPADEGEGASHGAPNENDAEDVDFNMDADYDPAQPSYTSGKKKKKSKFQKLMEKKKPTFEEVCKKYDGSDHPFGDYLDEYFKLDCEDIIAGDVKCRFHYRKTVPNDYGLTVEEILKCPDRELNAWASLRNIIQYKNEKDEMYEVRKYKKSKKLRKKNTILPSLTAEIGNDLETTEELEEQWERHIEEEISENDNSFMLEPVKDDNETDSLALSPPAKKKKKQKRKAEETDKDVSTVALEAATPKKKKGENSRKSESVDLSNDKSEGRHDSVTSEDSEAAPTKKKKRAKAKERESVDLGGDKSVPKQKKGKGAKSTAKIGAGSDKEEKKKPKKPKKKNAGPAKRPGYSVGQMSSESRLLSLGIDPNKFKYTKHMILQDPGNH